MKTLWYTKLLPALLGVSSFFAGAGAHAATFEDASGRLEGVGRSAYGESNADAQADLPLFIGSIVQVALILVGTVFMLLIIYGGYMWMIARGDTEKVKKAKDIITSAVIGLFIVLAAYAITNFVLGAIT
jgi:uncharacterized iron-regulated membrane protein